MYDLEVHHKQVLASVPGDKTKHCTTSNEDTCFRLNPCCANVPPNLASPATSHEVWGRGRSVW